MSQEPLLFKHASMRSLEDPQNMMVAPFLLRVLHSSWNAIACRMRESVEQSINKGSTAKVMVMTLNARPGSSQGLYMTNLGFREY